ncbi:hypothetical protein T265_12369 [Opisthorchis viverrini]|uniref:Uncharacterized protein n=1 Tax=Opisthorchis viverrini TaxID=6198 RepID=A0A074YTJ7_OPIVI|nr:hypothetical protein T265_12369 [Opisthorchis viverrini]KER18116.1 hypothetical protein T265_12369 [Opisthorchis viverrini]
MAVNRTSECRLNKVKPSPMAMISIPVEAPCAAGRLATGDSLTAYQLTLTTCNKVVRNAARLMW